MPRKKVQKTYSRRRCDNCGTLFEKNKKNRRFCKDQCRYEWNNNGAGFGKLRDTIERLIKREMQKQLRNFDERIRALEKGNGGLLDTIAHGEARERKFQELINGKP